MSRQKNHRARRAIKKLNEIRHRQEKKIDILCNDMVGAHRDFIDQLKAADFSIRFYESIVGKNDLQTLMNASAGFIGDNIAEARVAAFLLDDDGFQLHMADDNRPIEVDQPRLENCFSLRLVEAICKANSVCSLDEMLQMGLNTEITDLTKISAAAMPLGSFGKGVGFILIYRDADSKLTAQELGGLRAITPGLYRAIESVRQSTQTSEI